VGLFGAGFVLFAIGARRGWFGRHLVFRALAEALRIRFFLVLSGSGGAVSTRRLLRLTSIEHFKGFGWIGDAIRCSEPLTYESSVSAQERVAATSERWVKDQAAYFSRKRRQLHHEHERLEKVKKFLFLAAFLGAASLLFFKKTLYGFHVGDLDGKTIVVFLMGLLPLWLAVWEIYQTKMATRELLWQYTNQGKLFDLAEKRLAAISDPAHSQDVISDLAERSLMDVVQWSTHRYHREHEPPSFPEICKQSRMRATRCWRWSRTSLARRRPRSMTSMSRMSSSASGCNLTTLLDTQRSFSKRQRNLATTN
jgi:hypothetical protein